MSCDANDRGTGIESRSYAGSHVDHAWPFGDHAHAGFTGRHRVAGRGVRCGLLVSHVHELDALFDAGIVYAAQRTGQREDSFHVLVLQGPADEGVAAVLGGVEREEEHQQAQAPTRQEVVRQRVLAARASLYASG